MAKLGKVYFNIDGVEFVVDLIDKILDTIVLDEDPEFIRGFYTFAEVFKSTLLKMQNNDNK